MSKFSNTKLVLLLVALVAAFAGVKYFDSKRGERNFRNELVKIDSAKVSTFLIYPKSKKGQEVKLFKEGKDWKVKVNESKSQKVDSARISGLFKAVIGMKPTRLAARGSDKWKDFEVDTSGSHLMVKEGDKTTLDIIIGKMNFSGGRNVETYVRLQGDNETYAVDGYLESNFNRGVDDWRDKILIKDNKDSWKKLSFALGDSMHYQLIKQDSVWMLDGVLADQKKVTDYLNSISTVAGAAFADDADVNSLGSPQFNLEIDDSTGNAFKVEGFMQGEKKILKSPLNPDNLINGAQGGIWEKIFADKFKFLPGSAPAN